MYRTSGVVIVISDPEWDDPGIIQIKNCTQIHLVNGDSFIPFEFYSSVSHFSFGFSAVNSLFSTFSAICCGLRACLVHPWFAYLIVDWIPFLRQIRRTLLSFTSIPWYRSRDNPEFFDIPCPDLSCGSPRSFRRSARSRGPFSRNCLWAICSKRILLHGGSHRIIPLDRHILRHSTGSPRRGVLVSLAKGIPPFQFLEFF